VSLGVFTVSENEARKKADELLRTGRRVFLEVAGIKETEILGLGDLATVAPEKIIELLHREALATVLRMRRLRVKTFRRRKQGRKK
jgi:hypothetical protein